MEPEREALVLAVCTLLVLRMAQVPLELEEVLGIRALALEQLGCMVQELVAQLAVQSVQVLVQQLVLGQQVVRSLALR